MQEIKITGEEPGKEDEASVLEKEEALEVAFQKRLRETASAEVKKFDAAVSIAAGEKKFWLVVTVPEVPVAGEQCLVFLNRQQSEALRSRPRVQLHYGFNRWTAPSPGAK